LFTGIIEGMGTIAEVERRTSLARLVVDVGDLTDGVELGDSVALDGCCLTVTKVAASRLDFEAIPETLALTSLAGKRPGDRLNIERALRAGGRLDGHIVQGHVDGTGEVQEVAREGDDVRLTVSCGPELSELLVPKGSIAIDGVSLTVVEPSASAFTVALIPHTLQVTTLGQRKAGDIVNLEADVLGKYVHAYLERIHPAGDRSRDKGVR
jgi:riboflavin synthase